MSDNRTQNELVLSPGEFAYSQDTTSGALKLHTGPGTFIASGQEQPVIFDADTNRFKKVSLSEAAQQFITAKQGQYIVLNNPTQDEKPPQTRTKIAAPEILNGRQVIIQGPTTFALWPGQSADVRDGHKLRSNQYLLVSIRDEETARANWTKGIIKKAINQLPTDHDGKPDATQTSDAEKSFFDSAPEDLSVGKLYVIRGDEISFYIPPTGVDVVREADGSYIRNAYTLERLEYCVLVDENGTKRYERGPKVVFPTPTERFYEEIDKRGEKHVVFKPIELNDIQGIHVKVISDYVDDDGTPHKEGEELFLRGDTTPIYFPRAEHSLITYDRKHKTYATCVPAGEGRYILERQKGIINLVQGPMMLLPDPRSQVIVNRVLSDKQCRLWYPGNEEVERYNAALRPMMAAVSSTRGAISEGELERAASKKLLRGAGTLVKDVLGFADRSTTHSDTMAVGMEEMERGATYNQPRTVTLDTKFAGVPVIEIWNGYAVMVSSSDKDKDGNMVVKRRVEVGPKRLLLEYNETLEVLSMSTGKPKSTDKLIQTVYLRVKNNQMSDIIRAETKDHVMVEFKVSMRGDFTGDPNKWFDVENYIKMLSDHVRSVVKGVVRQRTVEDVYADPTALLRDAVLGAKGEAGRQGMSFAENGFHLAEIELLDFKACDDRISKILDNTQHQVVESNIALALSERKLTIEKRQEELARERAQASAETSRVSLTLHAENEKFKALLDAEKVSRDLTLELQRLQALSEKLQKQEETLLKEQKLLDEKLTAELARKKQEAELDVSIKQALQELTLTKSREDTLAVVERFKAGSGQFAEALVALSSQETLTKVAEATSLQHYVGGANFVDALKSVLGNTPFGSATSNLIEKAMPKKNGAAKIVDAEKSSS